MQKTKRIKKEISHACIPLTVLSLSSFIVTVWAEEKFSREPIHISIEVEPSSS
jgi:hypothetical protein